MIKSCFLYLFLPNSNETYLTSYIDNPLYTLAKRQWESSQPRFDRLYTRVTAGTCIAITLIALETFYKGFSFNRLAGFYLAAEILAISSSIRCFAKSSAYIPLCETLLPNIISLENLQKIEAREKAEKELYKAALKGSLLINLLPYAIVKSFI